MTTKTSIVQNWLRKIKYLHIYPAQKHKKLTQTFK